MDLHPAEKYARDILDGKIVSCKWVKLACQRYFDDLEHGAERGIWFDRDAAQRRLDFYHFCKHSEGEWAGQIIIPEPWQQFVKWNLYGWKTEDGSRRFSLAYESLARKNGKSTDAATDGLYLAFFDGEAGAQVYSAATKYEQACIVHSSAINMVRKSPDLYRRIEILKNHLTYLPDVQKYVPLGQDAYTQDGLNVYGAIIDEYHAHPTADMYSVLKSGRGARKQSLIYIITTAGFEKGYPCYELEQRCKRILSQEEEDDSVFTIIYTLDEDDDPGDETLWIKSNPNLGVSKYIKTMQSDYKEARSIPHLLNEFLTKHLNIWTESQTQWISSEVWAMNNDPVSEEGLRGRKCYMGMDLSANSDLTAVVLCFPPDTDGEKYKFLFRFYLPQDNMMDREKKEKQPYTYWVKNGWLTTTPGNVIDLDYIRSKINADAKMFDIKTVHFDPALSRDIVPRLIEDGFECVEFRQGFLSMAPAVKGFELAILKGDLATGKNPIMNWMVACTETKTDPAGCSKFFKPDRMRTGKHIDGVVAACMAYFVANQNVDKKSVYEDRGVLLF
ncbi:terminase large subunit [Candidatus Pacearchaeota archaeon]|jgi:phage terminase large subunit-like protein|nr:terminase large subunit [Candidatus Pacearchaeota archaeon]